MRFFEKVDEIQKYLQLLREEGKRIGFIPTMGALHQGHLSLIEQSKQKADISVCSIFVNPTQFNQKEDLDKYPKTLESDSAKLESVHTDVLFAPREADIYPKDLPNKDLNLDFGSLLKVMEAKHRGDHFKGVVQVVDRLLDIVAPDYLLMGQKDFQQFEIIRKYLITTQRPIELVRCAIIRETDGLAMSSRNMRLSAEERQKAPFIYQTLGTCKDNYQNYTVKDLQEWAINRLNNNGFKVEYIEFVDFNTLLSVDDWHTAERTVICVAAWLGKIRLIDNLFIN